MKFNFRKALKVTGIVAGVAAVAGLAYLASRSGDGSSDEGENYPSFPCGNDEEDFSYVTDSWLQTASKDELYDTCDKMENLLDELDDCSDAYSRIYGIHIDVVNAIASRFPLNLPHREHGWYLPNDDD